MSLNFYICCWHTLIVSHLICLESICITQSFLCQHSCYRFQFCSHFLLTLHYPATCAAATSPRSKLILICSFQSLWQTFPVRRICVVLNISLFRIRRCAGEVLKDPSIVCSDGVTWHCAQFIVRLDVDGLQLDQHRLSCQTHSSNACCPQLGYSRCQLPQPLRRGFAGR